MQNETDTLAVEQESGKTPEVKRPTQQEIVNQLKPMVEAANPQVDGLFPKEGLETSLLPYDKFNWVLVLNYGHDAPTQQMFRAIWALMEKQDKKIQNLETRLAYLEKKVR